MSKRPGIVVMGVSGRMGGMLVREVMASEDARLVAALERPGHDWLGRDVGEALRPMIRLRPLPAPRGCWISPRRRPAWRWRIWRPRRGRCM